MNSNVVILNQNSPDKMWENENGLAQIKQLFAPKLTPMEFTMFVEMGKATGLNPFLKEIWAVKYDEKVAAQIFIGRDGYRKSAQRSPFYDFHVADAVYSNDTFDVCNGEVAHRYNLKDRGTLVGAYCTVQRKGSSRPIYTYVDIKEYDTNQSVWRVKKATMIKKVAEAQGLKAGFQELFAGTYNEIEQWDQENNTNTKQARGVQGLKEKLGISKPETIDESTGEVLESEVIISLDAVKILIENATSINDLVEAAEQARLLHEDDRKIIRSLYRKKEIELSPK